jgi:hypothetical protein
MARNQRQRTLTTQPVGIRSTAVDQGIARRRASRSSWAKWPIRRRIDPSQSSGGGRAGSADLEYLNVLFEDVRAVKLRASYRPLILQPADDSTRVDILASCQP